MLALIVFAIFFFAATAIRRLVPLRGSQKSKVKSQKADSVGFSRYE
ncbi:hypothetical protein [Scytonema sp. HK-05]